MTLTEKHVYELMQKPWHFVLVRDGDSWFVKVRELHGCMSDGKTWEETYRMIHDAMRGWLTVGVERGIPIPEPDED